MFSRWLLLSSFALVACSPKQIAIDVKIVTESCDAKVDPFAGVQYLRVRVTGDDLPVPLDSVATTGGESREIKIPDIPAGKNRVIEVRGFDGDPATGGKVLSVGKSLKFEVADVIPDPADNPPILVTIFLRKVNAFTPPSAAATPKDCQKMKVQRAGHTATVLKSGKVFIAGGYNFVQTTASRVSLSDTEIFNPTTNSFETSPRMAISNGSIWIPKAFHTATLLPESGQVLLWGGETYTGGVNNYQAPAAIILVYDADETAYGAVKTRNDPPSIARTGHQAAVDQNGKVLIVGGETRTASPPAPLVAADKVEWFDPKTNLYQVVDGFLPRKNPAVLSVRGGQFIAVAGGTDGTQMATEVVFFKWDLASSSFKREITSPTPYLAPPGRRAAAVATLNDGVDLLVLGGYSDPMARIPIASSEIVGTSSAVVSAGPSVGSSGPGGRGDICAVQLPDGKVLAIGGLTVDGPGPEARSDGSTVIIGANASGTPTGIGGPALSIPRYHHTCTALADGTVLVLGGVNEQVTGTKEILQDAWIYQPAPTDD